MKFICKIFSGMSVTSQDESNESSPIMIGYSEQIFRGHPNTAKGVDTGNEKGPALLLIVSRCSCVRALHDPCTSSSRRSRGPSGFVRRPRLTEVFPYLACCWSSEFDFFLYIFFNLVCCGNNCLGKKIANLLIHSLLK